MQCGKFLKNVKLEAFVNYAENVLNVRKEPQIYENTQESCSDSKDPRSDTSNKVSQH